MTTRFESDRDKVVPSVHFNGTSRDALLAQYRIVHIALSDAIGALAQASPHPRDYYVQPDSMAFERARQKHTDRVALLVEMQSEIEADYAAVAQDDDSWLREQEELREARERKDWSVT